MKPRKPHAISADEQVDAIVRMMATGSWRGMSSRAELAEQWGCHPRTVGDRAEHASHILKRTGGPLEQYVQEKLAELDNIKDTAMKLMKPIVVAGALKMHNFPDVKAAIVAIRTQLEIRGALGPAKRAAKDDEPTKMTDEELLARAKALVSQLETTNHDKRH